MRKVESKEIRAPFAPRTQQTSKPKSAAKRTLSRVRPLNKKKRLQKLKIRPLHPSEQDPSGHHNISIFDLKVEAFIVVFICFVLKKVIDSIK